MSTRFFIQVFAVPFFMWLLNPAWADEKNEKVVVTQVHGYEVFLVDVAQGNQMGYVMTVPWGSADDPPGLFGRAHFFEHMFARGSLKFPGYETLIKTITTLGYKRNAATGWDYTKYFAFGHEQHVIQAMTIHLAGLDAVELSEDAMTREKSTVINEVVLSRPNKPAGALGYLPFQALLPADDPLRGHHVGSLETLTPMSDPDLQDLHRRIYQPGVVRIAVFGNFSTGSVSRKQILASLKKILPEDRLPTQLKPVRPTTAFSNLKNGIVEAESRKDRLGIVYFNLPPDVDLGAVARFGQTLTLPFRNGLVDHLHRKRGWLEEMDAQLYRLGGRHVFEIDFRLTDLGYEHRDQVVETILAAIKSYQEVAIPEAIVAHQRTAVLTIGEKIETNLPLLLNQYAAWMTSGRSEKSLRFDWPGVAADWTSASIQAGARAITVQDRMTMFMGPLPPGAQVQTDPLYKMNYAIRPQTHSRPVAGLDLTQIEIPSVDLGPNLPGTPRAENSWRSREGQTFLFTHDPEWRERTVQVRFELAHLSPLDQVNFAALVDILSTELSPEFALFESQGIHLGMEVNSSNLTIQAQGQSGQEALAVRWLIRRLVEFQPSQEQLHRFNESAEMKFKRLEDDFPGIVVGDLAEALLDFNDPLANRAALAQLSLATIKTFRQTHLRQADKLIAVAGPYLDDEIEMLQRAMAQLSPQPLKEAGHTRPPRLRIENQSVTYHEGWLGSPQSGVGVAQVIALPPHSSVRERAAMNVVGRLLHDQVFLPARKLGYVQGVRSLMSPHFDPHLAFVGQVDDPAKLDQILDLWKEKIQEWLADKIAADEIEKIHHGVLASLNEKPTSSSAGLAKMVGNFKITGQPNYTELLLKELETLSATEISAVAKKYLATDRHTLSIVKGGEAMDCDAILKGRNEVRSRLIGL